MNDDKEHVSQISPTEAPAVPSGSWRDAVSPLCALVLAVLYWAVFGANHWNAFGPGLGVPVFVAAYYAGVILLLGKKARFSPGAVFLMAASLCLSVCCALYALPGIMFLNCLIILLTGAMATFSLSGHSIAGLRRWAVLPESVKLSAKALFTCVGKPFARLRLLRGHRDRASRVLVSILIAIPVLCLVLALLSAADAVFGSFFTGIAAWIRRLNAGKAAWHIIRALVLALFVSSGLYFIRLSPPISPDASPAGKERHTLPFLVVTVLLDGVYILFCAIQLRYLFGGAEAAAMAGGWAEYARTGFFQLVTVAVINLTLCLLAADKARFAAKGGLVLRIADGLLLLLTAVILLSAARRMQLYILAYGMSVLRLTTLWGMLVSAVGILCGAIKLCKPDFSFFPVFASFALSSWCALCLINPGGRIAHYNVEQYLIGRLETVDIFYLRELTTDALPALQELAAADDEYDGLVDSVREDLIYETQNPGGWSQWKLTYTWLREES